ncbi:MAG TPA: LamG domain-containing protein, partial [Ktedonobacterales bacterium]|nr:LamG domain-containing protein [Ktedonobacterales bacterium]
MAATTLRLGWTNLLTDAFDAHPVLGPALDLNDGVTFTLVEPGGIELSAPPRSVVAAGNPRTQGERASRALYRHNRRVVVRLLLGPMAAHADLAANLRALAAWLNAPPATPVTIQYQPPSASSPVYLDVVAAAHDLPSDERDWLRLQMEPLTLLLWCRPGLRGDRVTLSNLAVNPGFEQGSGPGVVAFADPLSNVNAYTLVAGTAPTLNPANSYVDIVTAAANGGSALLRYYRMGESSGTVAPDISGWGQNATYQGSFTRGAAGAITGDTDTAITFAGAGDISVPVGSGTTALPVGSGTTALPVGANPWSIVAWVKIAANPGSSQVVASFGTAAAGQGAHIAVDTTGKVYASVFGTNTPLSAAAVSLNAWHLVVGTYDGTTLRCYLDNAAATSVGVTANIGTTAAFIGEQVDGTAKISATIDEVGIYGAALSSAQVGTLYTAG